MNISKKYISLMKQLANGKWIYPLITVVFSAFGIVILMLIAGSDSMTYAWKPNYLNNSLQAIVHSFIAILACGMLTAAYRKKCKRRISDVNWCVKMLSVLLFSAQIFVSYNIFFLTDWDPGIVRTIAMQISAGQEITGWERNYHALYPNNLLMTLIQATVLRLHALFPIFEADYAYMGVIALNCLCMTVACYQLYLLSAKLFGEQWALIAYGLTVVLAGISPWMIIPYSDTFGLLFPVVIMNEYLTKRTKKHAEAEKWFKILAISIIGYHIKPQCIIVLIAVLFIHLVSNMNKRGLMRFGCIIISFVLLFTVCEAVLNSAAAANNIVLNDEAAIEWPHFLMMGLNSENNGVYSQADVDISQNITTATERKTVNFQIAGERIRAFGVLGLLEHLSKKLLTAFNDGMFAWGMEGTFYSIMFDPFNNNIAPLLRSVLYSNGRNYGTYASIIHTVWIGVLLLATISFIYKPQGRRQEGMAIVRLSLLGLILFELLFEVRARYLFTYVPFFVCMAVCGLRGLSDTLVHRMKKA